MTAENIRFVHELMESATFQQLLEELAEQESAARVNVLVSAGLKGDSIASARISGEIEALRALPAIFRRYASKYQVAT